MFRELVLFAFKMLSVPSSNAVVETVLPDGTWSKLA
jgi:hypothetical protein